MKSIISISGLFIVLSSDAMAAETIADADHLEISGTKLKFYGFVRLDALYSDSRLSHNQFPMFVRREDKALGDKNNDEHLDMHPRLTRFGFDMTRDSIPQLEGFKAAGKFEIDWQNRATTETVESESRQLPRLRHAFLKISNESFSLLAGQTWDLISPLFPSVNSDSLMWNSGNIGDRRPQLRVTYAPAPDVSVEFALARTGAVDLKDLDSNGRRDGDDSGLPMAQFRIGAASLLNEAVIIGLWGHRALEETDTKVGGDDEFTSNSIGVDINVRMLSALSIASELWKGRNLSDIRGGIGQGVNSAAGDEIDSQGGWLEANYNASESATLFAGYGLDNPDDGDLSAGSRKLNTARWLGVRYDLGGGISAGLEYINWRTDYDNQGDGDANRYNIYFAYKF